MLNLHLSPPQEKETVREYAYRILKENILSLTLIPEMKISEKEVSDTLSISRTPVREAFIRLSQENLLEILPQRGTYISKINTDQISEFRFLRVTLEQAVMKLACTEFPEEYASKLVKCLNSQEKCVINKSFDKFFELDNEMHCIIFTGCQKPNIWKMIREANLNYVRARVLDLQSRQSEIELLFQQHAQIVKAILDKDVTAGNHIITKHVNKVIDDVADLKAHYPDYFK